MTYVPEARTVALGLPVGVVELLQNTLVLCCRRRKVIEVHRQLPMWRHQDLAAFLFNTCEGQSIWLRKKQTRTLLTEINWDHGMIFVWRKNENMSPCTGSRVITSYELGYSLERGPPSLKATPPPTIMPSILTTRPWPIRQKTDWYQPYGITHPAQQRADYEQEWFFTGLLTPGTRLSRDQGWTFKNWVVTDN